MSRGGPGSGSLRRPGSTAGPDDRAAHRRRGAAARFGHRAVRRPGARAYPDARASAYGRIWNEIQVVEGYRLRDRYVVAEAEIIDWMISRPNGTEEGNVVGKFLDTWQR